MTHASPNPYSTLPMEGPDETAIGSALITMVEPHPGHEREYNRWYEDDHFYSGAMAMPWMFAGRRWVAPRDLQLLRYPEDSAIAQPVTAGCYISLYWITAGRYEDHLRWTVAANQRLNPNGRIYYDRTHVYTAFQEYVGSVRREETGPRDYQTLDYPYGGLVVEVVDAVEGVERDALWAWLRDEHVPAVLEGSGVAMCLAFRPVPLPDDKQEFVADLPGLDDRLTLLWFTDDDPRTSWTRAFVPEGDAVAASGLGKVELVAPFIPTIPGTDTYVDDLR